MGIGIVFVLVFMLYFCILGCTANQNPLQWDRAVLLLSLGHDGIIAVSLSIYCVEVTGARPSW